MPRLSIDLTNDSSLPAELQSLIAAAPLPGLGDGPEYRELAQWLRSNASRLAPLAQSGLWLLAGDLDASHRLSQDIETPDGSFWHGIMHRREGDFWNAKYWFRRVGRHPVLAELAKQEYGAADTFVDRCEAAQKPQASATAAAKLTAELQAAQWQEWQLLFIHCLNKH